MASYQDRILQVIGESDVGLTTVDVARKAGVSKTTVIKYLSMLSSEGRVEFVEVGPSKLWMVRNASSRQPEGRVPLLEVEALPVVDIDFGNGENKTLCFSFRVKPDQICSLMKRARKCLCDVADTC